MPEPAITAATATLIATAAVLPVLAAAPAVVPQIVIFGFALGLRADVLLAGFLGSLVAIGFLNAVPSSGDTWRELVRTTARRMLHALCSSVTSGYLTPLFLLLEGPKLQIPETLMLSVAFVIGVGAQGWLARVLKKGNPLADKAGAALAGDKDE